MPSDITMCPGDPCPLRARCYRYRALADARQDWFGASPYDPSTGRCDSFWDVDSLRPTESAIRDRAYHLFLSEGRAEGHAERHWAQAERELHARFEARLRPL